MSIHVRIIQGRDLIADLPEWDGPIPRVDDYIFHPPLDNSSPADGGFTNIAGHVATVTWYMYQRPEQKEGQKYFGAFVPTSNPYVEIHFPS